MTDAQNHFLYLVTGRRALDNDDQIFFAVAGDEDQAELQFREHLALVHGLPVESIRQVIISGKRELGVFEDGVFKLEQAIRQDFGLTYGSEFYGEPGSERLGVYAVLGRECGDDVDTCMLILAKNEEDAKGVHLRHIVEFGDPDFYIHVETATLGTWNHPQFILDAKIAPGLIQHPDSRPRQEFNPGDLVTFNPYGTPLRCKVVDVIPPTEKNGRYRYQLVGQALTRTTGVSIEQSSEYEPCPALIEIPPSLSTAVRSAALDVEISQFNFGDIRRASLAISSKIQSDGSPVSKYVEGALLEATGNRNGAVKAFQQALSEGLYEAKERIERPRDNLYLSLQDTRGQGSVVLMCERNQLDEAIKVAKAGGFAVNGTFPGTDGRLPFLTSFSMTADYYRLKRFKDDLQNGRIGSLNEPPPKKVSSGPSI